MRKRSGLSLLASATRMLCYVLIVLAILLVALVITHKVFDPFKVVGSNSMWPQIRDGDAVVLKDIDTKDVKIGDVIVFRNPFNRDQLIIHRVVKIEKDKGRKTFITKGDNNPEGDIAEVSPGQIVGAVAFNIPRFGSFLEFLSEPRGYLGCIAIPAAVAISLVFLLGIGETAEKKHRQKT
jgi:signal peptidase I